MNTQQNQPSEHISISKLSRLTGKDRRTIEKRLAGVTRHPKGFALAEVLPILSESKTTDAKRLKEIEKLTEQIEDIRSNRAIRLREYVPLAEARRAAAKCILTAKGRFNDNVDAIASAAAMKLGLTGDEVCQLRVIVADHTAAALKILSQGDWKGIACPHCSEEIQ